MDTSLANPLKKADSLRHPFGLNRMARLLLAVLLLAFSLAAHAGQTADGLAWSASNSQITITGYSGTSGVVSISGTIGGLPVTGIGSQAFSACTTLTSVTIPGNVTSIGDEAFAGCSKLKSAVFLGNAPTMASSVFGSAAPGFTVYYSNGATGFTSPTWNGYPACVAGKPTISTATPLPPAIVGATYSQTLAATGGAAPYAWSLTAGSLPAGLSLSGSTGVIAGTPTAAASGSFTLQAAGQDGQSSTKICSLAVVANLPPVFTGTISGITATAGSQNGSVDLKLYARDPDVTGTVVRLAMQCSIPGSAGGVISDIDLALYDTAAPNTVQNFLKYVAGKYYDGTFIHRSVKNFMIQGGGYSISGSSAYQITNLGAVVNEFSPTRSNVAGTIAMAKLDGDPNSASNEWFINAADNSANLDKQNGGFTVFGRVVGRGMELVNAINGLATPNHNDPKYHGPFPDVPVISGSTLVWVNSATIIPALTFKAASSNSGVVNPTVSSDGILTLQYKTPGSASVTVTATDLYGASVSTSFPVTVQAVLAAMTAPATGSAFTSGTGTFTWNTGAGVSAYSLWVGSAAGMYDIYGGVVTGGSKTLGNLPTDGRTLYVRLYSLINGAYQFNSYTYKAFAKVDNTLTFGPLPGKAYGDAPFALTGTASSWLPVSYTSSNPAVARVSGSTVTILAPGATVLTASQAGDGNYKAATSVTQTLTVSKGAATVTLNNLGAPFTYDGAVKAASVTVTPAGLPVTVTYNGSLVVPSAAGTYAVVATVNSPNYQGKATGALTINKAANTITFGALPGKAYGNPAFALTATASSKLPVTYTSSNPAVAALSYGYVVVIVGSGSTTLTASQAGNGNYNAAPSVSQPLVVGKAAATVTLGNLSQPYTGAAKTATVSTVPAGLPVSVTYNGSTAPPSDAGSYAVAATVNSPNYQCTAFGTLNITKVANTITFGALPAKMTSDATFALTATASSKLPVSYTSSNPAVATVSGSQVTIVGSGTTTITASQAGNCNYNTAPNVTQPLVVRQLAQMLTPVNGSTLAPGTGTFTWDAGSGVSAYSLWAGTSQGAYNLFGGVVTGGSKTLTNLPSDGRTVYVRLYSLINGVYQYNSYTYTAYSAGGLAGSLLSGAAVATNGSLTINAAQVIGNPNVNGSLTVNPAATGSLTLSSSNTGCVINNSINSGSGTLILTNTSGVSNGTLQLGGGDNTVASGSLTLNPVATGTLALVSGTIVGTGVLVIDTGNISNNTPPINTGSGTLILTNTNGIENIISSGTLQVGGDNTAVSGSLTLNLAVTGTLALPVSSPPPDAGNTPATPPPTPSPTGF